MEEEVREILRAAALRVRRVETDGLGTRIAARFCQDGLDTEIDELRGQPAQPGEFDE